MSDPIEIEKPTGPGLIVAMPQVPGEALHWWALDDGSIVDEGQDVLVRDAAGRPIAVPGEHILVLVPAALTAIGFSRHAHLTEPQAEVTARIAALRRSVGGEEQNHAAARAVRGPDAESADGVEVVTAVIDKARLAASLAELEAQGIDPDVVLPVSLVLPPPIQGYAAATIGAEQVLRGLGLAGPDEPELREPLVGSDPVVELSPEIVPALLEDAFAAPALNLRSGLFAKRRGRAALTRAQVRTLLQLTAALLLLSLLVEVVVLAKLNIDTSAQDSRALALLQRVAPETDDLAAAERRLDEKLSARGAGGTTFGVPAAALFSAVQPVSSLVIRSIGFGQDGTMAATLSAPRADDINAALLSLQRAGYRVTAMPRQEASGSQVADITVRAP